MVRHVAGLHKAENYEPLMGLSLGKGVNSEGIHEPLRHMMAPAVSPKFNPRCGVEASWPAMQGITCDDARIRVRRCVHATVVLFVVQCRRH